jgi:hypothetical protein
VVGSLKRLLRIDTLLFSFGLDDGHVHSPNEKFELACYRHGARAHVRLLSAIRRVSDGVRSFDRHAEDVRNIIEFGQINLRVPEQRAATRFYGEHNDPWGAQSTEPRVPGIVASNFCDVETSTRRSLCSPLTWIAVRSSAWLQSRLSKVYECHVEISQTLPNIATICLMLKRIATG